MLKGWEWQAPRQNDFRNFYMIEETEKILSSIQKIVYKKYTELPERVLPIALAGSPGRSKGRTFKITFILKI